MASISNLVGQEIFAALGADFFEGQIIQFDFKNKVIRFMDKLPANLIDNKNPRRLRTNHSFTDGAQAG
jgi:hypothetical protein